MNRVILIKSCRQYRNRREACDLTWAGALRRAGIKVFYVEGGYDYLTISNSDFGGLIGVTTGDTKDYNTVKLKEALSTLLMWSPGWEYIFICDDDTFVHPTRWLDCTPAIDIECLLYHPSTREGNLTKGKPWITGGSGWWMSRTVTELYCKECQVTASWDDTLVSKVAYKHNIRMDNRPDLYGGDKYSGRLMRVNPNNTLITCHHISPEEMLKLYEENKLNEYASSSLL